MCCGPIVVDSVCKSFLINYRADVGVNEYYDPLWEQLEQANGPLKLFELLARGDSISSAVSPQVDGYT